MRKSRLKFEGTGYYHCMSRIIEKRFIMGDREKEYFVELMRNLAEFSGLRILTYSVLSNHFHVLLQCPQREDVSDRLLLKRLHAIYPAKKVAQIAGELTRRHQSGEHAAVEDAPGPQYHAAARLRRAKMRLATFLSFKRVF